MKLKLDKEAAGAAGIFRERRMGAGCESRGGNPAASAVRPQHHEERQAGEHPPVIERP